MQISLLEKLSAFFKNIENIGHNLRWDSELYLMDICLKNVIVNILINNKKGQEYYKTLVGQTQANKYVNSVNYEKHQQIFKKYEKDFKELDG